MAVRQTYNELLGHLADHVRWLRSSAAAFDAGDASEAKRLTNIIRALVWKTPSVTPLLTQLGVLDTMMFLDTAGDMNPLNLMATECRLTVLRFPPGDHYPTFDRVGEDGLPRLVPFGRWWNTPVVRDDQGGMFSRADLVLAVVHKDGGTHVDNMRDAYARLTRSNSLGWVLKNDLGTHPMNNPVLPAIRQITYELDGSLCGEFPAFSPRT